MFLSPKVPFQPWVQVSVWKLLFDSLYSAFLIRKLSTRTEENKLKEHPHAVQHLNPGPASAVLCSAAPSPQDELLSKHLASFHFICKCYLFKDKDSIFKQICRVYQERRNNSSDSLRISPASAFPQVPLLFLGLVWLNWEGFLYGCWLVCYLCFL